MPERSSSCRSSPADIGPHLERTRPCGSMLAGGDVVAAEMEEVVDLAVCGEEALCLPRRLDALHLAFSSPCRLVRILGPVAQALVLAVLDAGHQLPLRCAAAAELISDHHARRPALPHQQLAQQAPGCVLVAPALDQHVEHNPGLVDRAPQPVLDPGNLDDDLIEMPLVPGAGQPPPDPAGELLAELERPLPHVSWLTTMPRAASISSTMRRLSGKRKCRQTAWLMTSAGKR
jgi:hypothetical protein